MRRQTSKDSLVSWLTAPLFYNSHNSGNFHSIEKNKIPKSKSGSRLSKSKSISDRTKVFALLLIKRRTFLGHPVES